MDPLSLTASIIAVLQLTQSIAAYANSARNASREQKNLAIEAASLYGLLTTLRFRVEDTRSGEPWFNQVKLLGAENGPLDQLQALLERLVEKISLSSPAFTSSTSSLSKILANSRSTLMWKLTKQDVEDVLHQVERLKTLINLALVNDLTTLTRRINDDVDDLTRQTERISIGVNAIQESFNDELKNKISKWLELPDPSVNYHAARGKRQANTGLWLTKGLSFQHWKSSNSSSIWLHGKPGCGKTILSSTALEDILQSTCDLSDSYVGYFFFDFNDRNKQSWSKAARSLLFQFSVQIPGISQALEKLYKYCQNGSQQPSDTNVSTLLRDCMASAGHKYVLLDALDECIDREPLLDLLEKLIQQQESGLHILMTSRCERDIQDYLDPITDHKIDIQHAVIEDDINLYIHDRLRQDRRLEKWPSQIKDEIARELMKSADGMFRWVYCQIERLRGCIRLDALRQALSSLPRTLDDTYDRIMKQIELQSELDLAIWILQWLCFSQRPLFLSEINEVIAMRLGNETGFWPEQCLPDPFDVTRICSSLISCIQIEDDLDEYGIYGEDWQVYENRCSTLDEEIRELDPTSLVQVRLAHYSVKEYLLSERCPLNAFFQASRSHEQIAEGCLHYLLHISMFNNGSIRDRVVLEYPLAYYAANKWSNHMRQAEGRLSATTINLASCLVFERQSNLISWCESSIDDPLDEPSDYALENGVPPSIVDVVRLGLVDLLSEALKRGADIEAKDSYGATALVYASLCGHEKVVKLLLERGADVGVRHGFHGTALVAASHRGHEKVVKLLLERGADVGARDHLHRTPLLLASLCGYEQVVKLLLERGADVEARDHLHRTPLLLASAHGFDTVVKLLLGEDVDIDARSDIDHASLVSAALNGHTKVVELIIQRSADIEAGDRFYNTPLIAVSAHGWNEIRKLLKEKPFEEQGVIRELTQDSTDGPMGLTLLKGHTKVVELLLSSGAIPPQEWATGICQKATA